jgi:hypothetical protein
VHETLIATWPRLDGRIIRVSESLDEIALSSDDVVVSCHACGALTDRVIDRAVVARARVAVLPCCHDDETCDAGPLQGWFGVAEAVDAVRAVRLEQRGYRVWTQTIPAAITPRNRLLIGAPR